MTANKTPHDDVELKAKIKNIRPPVCHEKLMKFLWNELCHISVLFFLVGNSLASIDDCLMIWWYEDYAIAETL